MRSVTKELWHSFGKEKKVEILSKRLTRLIKVDKGEYPFYNGFRQGGLPAVKKKLETQILQFIDWENDRF